MTSEQSAHISHLEGQKRALSHDHFYDHDVDEVIQTLNDKLTAYCYAMEGCSGDELVVYGARVDLLRSVVRDLEKWFERRIDVP